MIHMRECERAEAELDLHHHYLCPLMKLLHDLIVPLVTIILIVVNIDVHTQEHPFLTGDLVHFPLNIVTRKRGIRALMAFFLLAQIGLVAGGLSSSSSLISSAGTGAEYPRGSAE